VTCRRWLALGFGAAWAAWAGLVTIRLAGRAPDDMLITFRYAWNLAHGAGFVFNPGERVFGLTNPGHALVLALLHAVTRVPVHLLAGIVFAAALWGLAWLLWREGVERGTGAEALAGGTLVLASSYVWVTTGSASAVVLALLAASARLVHDRPALAGLLAGLAVWYRPDALLGVAVLGLLAWLERRRFPWRWALFAGGLVAVGLAAAWLWFGSPVPGTLEAKRVMAAARGQAWAGPERFWARAAPLFARHFGRAWMLWTGLGVAGAWPLFARGGRAMRTVLCYGAGVAVAYPLLGVPFFNWYTVPPVVALLYGAGGLAVGVGRAGARALGATADPEQGSAPPPRWARATAAAVVAVALALPAVGFARASLGRLTSVGGPSRFDTYREAGLWIREHSRPDERIFYGEIGNLAYWSRRPVDDPLGLVTPASLPYVAAGDPIGAFLRRPPDLYIDHPASPHPGIATHPWFQAAYEPVARFADPDGGPGATVYRRRPGVRLPPPRPPLGTNRGKR
jgi:hypothetical protein